MANVNDRIGSQNTIRVLSNASTISPKLINLLDVDDSLKTQDGMILVWDLPSQTFIMTSVIDKNLSILGSIQFENPSQSTLPTNGALVVVGGVGIGKNLNVGGSIKISGISTFSSDLDINAAVDILNQLNVQGNFRSIGITTLASDGGITTTGGDLYVGGDLYIKDDLAFDEFTARNANVTGISTLNTLVVSGLSTFTGISTFNNNVFVAGTLTAGLIDGGEY